MEDEDLDFAAWAAPPAPANLADRVIARVNATDDVIAVVKERQRTRRVFWLAGGLAATLAAAAIIAIIVLTRSPAPAGAPNHGTTLAVLPQQLALPGAIANLDPGADVSWQASGDTVHVQQRRGAATWHVGKPQLFLEVGAAVASIEASNATLRVETRMNLSDVRVVGAAALTSAAVALVTVSVYEGQAKLSSAGQTVVVQPGTTYQVLPGQPPKVETPVAGKHEVTMHIAGTPSDDGPQLVLRLGERVTVHSPRGALRISIDKQCASDASPLYPNGVNALTELGDYHFTYTCNGIDKHGELVLVQDLGDGVLTLPYEGMLWPDRVEVAGPPVPARAQVTIDGVPVETQNNKAWRAEVTPAAPGFLAVRVDAGLDAIDYYIRDGRTREQIGDKTVGVGWKVERIAHGMKYGPLSVKAVDMVMQSIEPKMIKCLVERSDGQMLTFEVQPTGLVGKLAASIDDGISEACVKELVRGVRFAKAKAETHVTYSLAPPCSSDDLLDAGTAALARGDHAAALQSYDSALRCKFDLHSLQLAFMAACRANKIDYARKYWRRMGTDMKSHLLQMCLHEHITQDQLDE